MALILIFGVFNFSGRNYADIEILQEFRQKSGILVKKACGFTFLMCNLKLHCWYHSFLRSWQDEWVLGLKDTPFNISSTSIHVGNDNLPIIEIQTFLENWSIITADGVKRCNVCYIFKELHNNILSMHTSDCLSQVSTLSSLISNLWSILYFLIELLSFVKWYAGCSDV